jgi:hypothetical protein
MNSEKPNLLIRILRKFQYSTLAIIFLSLLLLVRIITPQKKIFLEWGLVFFICLVLWPIEWVIREIITAKKNGIKGFKEWFESKKLYEKIGIILFITGLLLAPVIPIIYDYYFTHIIIITYFFSALFLAGCEIQGICIRKWMVWPATILLTIYIYTFFGYSISKMIIRIKNLIKK